MAEPTQGHWSMLQDFIAPIALENLNCTGAEERLVDCPGATETEYSDYVYLYQGSGATIGTCDPVQGTFAFVSCGPATGTGMTRPCLGASRSLPRVHTACVECCQ